jgi:hypothetical protein
MYLSAIVVLTSYSVNLGRAGESSCILEVWVQGYSCNITPQAGNQVGEAFWRMLLAEHGLDDAGVSSPLKLRTPPI